MAASAGVPYVGGMVARANTPWRTAPNVSVTQYVLQTAVSSSAAAATSSWRREAPHAPTWRPVAAAKEARGGGHRDEVAGPKLAVCGQHDNGRERLWSSPNMPPRSSHFNEMT